MHTVAAVLKPSRINTWAPWNVLRETRRSTEHLLGRVQTQLLSCRSAQAALLYRSLGKAGSAQGVFITAALRLIEPVGKVEAGRLAVQFI